MSHVREDRAAAAATRGDRAVSTSLDYTMTLAIATILITGLLVASVGFVDDRREEVVRDELSVIGQQVVSDLNRADRLVTAADSSGSGLDVSTNQTFPDRVAGTTYFLRLDPGADRLVLESPQLDVRVSVGVDVRTSMGESTADGGVVRVAYVKTDGDYRLEVQNG